MIKIHKNYEWLTGMDTSFINLYTLGEVSEELSDQEQSKFIFYSDGIALTKLMKLFHKKDVQRLSFDDTSLAPIVFEYAVNNAQKIGLIGGAPGTTTKASQLLTEKYPGIDIVLCKSGFFDDSSSREKVIEEALATDILIIGMGGGYQERFLLDMRKAGWKGTGFTCGGYLDQLIDAKGKLYYPYLIDKLNLRWCYRLCKEPRRLFYRYFINYPVRLIKYRHRVC